MLQQFIVTVYVLVSAGKWVELAEYFALIREILTRPTASIRPGQVQDKEIK